MKRAYRHYVVAKSTEGTRRNPFQVCHCESRASRGVTIPNGIASIMVKVLMEAIPLWIVTSLRSSQ